MSSHEVKSKLFQQLMLEVDSCKRCSLWRYRKRPVLGDGDINALIVLIGEAPGYWEDMKGKPFVGPAGRLLNELLKEVSILRDQIYITNIVKCRPPENREPRPEEVAACKEYLDRQLDLIKPKVIVTLGRHSTAYVFSKVGIQFKSMSEVQGKIYEVNFLGMKVYIIPSYHPAAALYNMKLKDEIRETMKLVKRISTGFAELKS